MPHVLESLPNLGHNINPDGSATWQLVNPLYGGPGSIADRIGVNTPAFSQVVNVLDNIQISPYVPSVAQQRTNSYLEQKEAVKQIDIDNLLKGTMDFKTSNKLFNTNTEDDEVIEKNENEEQETNNDITNEEQDKTQDPMVTAMVGAASQAIEGITGIVSGLVGQRKRKAEQRAAKRDFDNQMAEFRAIDTSNPFANVQNPYEDLTVNLKEAQFQAQQQQLGMATAMGQMRGAAGSSGVAAMAQAMANQQSINLQRSAASIGQQESRNQALAAQGAERRETLLAQGEQESRRMQFAKQNRLLDITSDRKIAADEAVAAARQSMISGVGNLVGGLGTAAIHGAMDGDKGMFGIGKGWGEKKDDDGNS